MQETKKKDSTAVRAWMFYDWANSVYSLVISTAIFPIYYASVTANETTDQLNFFGWEITNTVLYSYALSFSFFLVVLLSPVLSGIADLSSRKKEFLKQFCYMGATAVAFLFFFDGLDTLWIGILGTIVASVGFWGSQVFYNAFLPEIAPKKEQDRVSGKGFALGYLGSSILMILMMVFIQFYEVFGISDSGMATRISFVIVAIWWAGFAQVTFRGLPESGSRVKIKAHHIWDGYKQLRKTWDKFQDMVGIKTFLLGFFLLSTGVQTIILLATPFGTKVLGMGTTQMITTILIIQFLAIAGSQIFSRLSGKIGNIKAIIITLVIWSGISVIAWSLQADDPLVEYKFYAMGGLVGVVMGGVQSLARSTYSKMLPTIGEHTTFFSFYDVTEKIAIVIGTFFFGFIEELSGDMHNSALFLAVFFIASVIVMTRVKYNFKEE
ncbi:MAG: UMF1 family MFS transporter [Salibacteraceae bacterium]|jgi:UMF1 family MFS transporter